MELIHTMKKLLLEVEFGPHKLLFPLNWHSVTLSQFNRLTMAGNSVLESVRALADDPSLIELIPDPLADVKIYELMPFLSVSLDVPALPVPSTVNVGQQWVSIPQDMGLETFGQKKAIDALFASLADPNDFISVAAEMLTIYLFPQLAGKPYRATENIDEYAEQVKQLPVTEALAVAHFFLSDYSNLKPFGAVSYRAKGRRTLNLQLLKTWFRKWLHLPTTG